MHDKKTASQSSGKDDHIKTVYADGKRFAGHVYLSLDYAVQL